MTEEDLKEIETLLEVREWRALIIRRLIKEVRDLQTALQDEYNSAEDRR